MSRRATPENEAAELLLVEYLAEGPATTRELSTWARGSIVAEHGRWRAHPDDPRCTVATQPYARLSRLARLGLVTRFKDPVTGAVLWALDITSDGLAWQDARELDDEDAER